MEKMKRDLLILSYLRQNSRMKLTDMSRASRIPVSTLFDRIVDFESRGIIKRLTSLVKFECFGYRGRALVVLSTDKKDRDKLLQLLEDNRNVNSLYKINNGWDFMAELIFPGLKEVEDFVEDIEEQVALKNKKVFYIIDELKKEKFMANPETVKLSGALT